MRHHIAICAAAAVASASTACSKPAPAPATPPPAPTVFDPLKSNLDRAQQVQGVVAEQAQASRRAVAAQEQGDATN